MKIFKNIEFWKNIFCSERKPISDKLYGLLLIEGRYKKEQWTNQFEGEKVDYELETISIDIPITKDNQLVLEFDIGDKELCEHQLYLVHKNKPYKLGMRDNFHCDDTVFKVDEFYKLINVLKNKDTLNYKYYFLLLSVYVTLTNDEEALKLTNDSVKLFYEIFPQKKKSNIEIRKVEPEFLKRKIIGDKNNIICFTISEIYDSSSLLLHYNKTNNEEEDNKFLNQLWENFINSLN